MIIIRDIKVKLNNDITYQQESLLKKSASLMRIKPSGILELKILKRSIDARKKPELFYNYQVVIRTNNEDSILKKNKNNKIAKYKEVIYNEPKFIGENENDIYIIGAGPAGLFCGLILAKAGLNPVIVERGSSVEKRKSDVDKFWNSGKLNPDSNVQFGEGGAGTFSDGKLNTLVKDKMGRNRYVLETFVANGANKDILYDAKPHMGTDVLVDVIHNMREEIIKYGGKFLFDTKLEEINYKFNKIESIRLSGAIEGIFNCDYICLAIGHSARDTFKMLYDSKVNMTGKQFAVGLRIEHLQDEINKVQYGFNYKGEYEGIEPCAYKVTANLDNGRGVFSFCMCPGGYVINASSEEGMLAINGMSDNARDSINSNSAIIVTVGEKDFDINDPMAAIEFQRELERKAYEIGKGNIPIQVYGDYKNNTTSDKLGSVKPTGKCRTSFANLRELFSDDINNSIVEGIEEFGRKIKGFDNEDALLSGVESRTSSPVRILRNKEMISNIDNLFPCGEGAGYAGGIMSAAMDGMKVAEAMIDKMHYDINS
ncbi:MAG: FAD-dependent oxidoreductase [Lachnospiraceae bacterium]|nr:FAD-dependent oxidoreductase [Lachnospiraceae bacterium]